MNHKTDMQAELRRVASELRAYNPAADEYKGEHIHKVWAREIEAALASRSDAQERLASENVVKDSVHKVSQGIAQADERGALMCERLRAMGLNTANEAADLIEQMGRAAAPQAGAPQGVPEGWTGNHEANSALIMLDRLDVSSDDDVRVDAISAIVRKLAAAPSAHAAVAGELIYQVRAETWGRQWSDVPKSIFDKKAALEGWKVRIVYTIPQALAAAPAPVSEPEQPSERIDQECPHGVDDAACKQCYGEAVRGSCPDGRVCEIGCFGECEKRAASAPTLSESEWPSDRDAAVQACALMILGICKTRPHEVWPKEIEGRIRYMLSKMQPQAAEPKGCPRCISSTAAGCNDIGCGYLDAGSGEPNSAEPKGLTEEERRALLAVLECADTQERHRTNQAWINLREAIDNARALLSKGN